MRRATTAPNCSDCHEATNERAGTRAAAQGPRGAVREGLPATRPDYKFPRRAAPPTTTTRRASASPKAQTGACCCTAVRGRRPHDVVRALELTWADLFPDGHHNARRHPTLAKPVAAIDLVLGCLLEMGIDYRATRSADFWTAERCPACRRETGGVLWIQNDDGRVRLSCMYGCAQLDVLAALVGEATP